MPFDQKEVGLLDVYLKRCRQLRMRARGRRWMSFLGWKSRLDARTGTHVAWWE